MKSKLINQFKALKEKYVMRKLNIGLVSVLLGISLVTFATNIINLNGNDNIVYAQQINNFSGYGYVQTRIFVNNGSSYINIYSPDFTDDIHHFKYLTDTIKIYAVGINEPIYTYRFGESRQGIGAVLTGSYKGEDPYAVPALNTRNHLLTAQVYYFSMAAKDYTSPIANKILYMQTVNSQGTVVNQAVMDKPYVTEAMKFVEGFNQIPKVTVSNGNSITQAEQNQIQQNIINYMKSKGLTTYGNGAVQISNKAVDYVSLTFSDSSTTWNPFRNKPSYQVSDFITVLNKSAASNAISAAENVMKTRNYIYSDANQTNGTTPLKTAFNNALNNLKNLVSSSSATQQQINNAVSAMNQATNNLDGNNLLNQATNTVNQNINSLKNILTNNNPQSTGNLTPEEASNIQAQINKYSSDINNANIQSPTNEQPLKTLYGDISASGNLINIANSDITSNKNTAKANLSNAINSAQNTLKNSQYLTSSQKSDLQKAINAANAVVNQTPTPNVNILNNAASTLGTQDYKS